MRAIIFDLDGLMIDSEPLSLRVWQEILAPYGKALTHEDYVRMIGMSSEISSRFVVERTAVPVAPEDLSRSHWDRLLTLIDTDVAPQPGLLELIAELVERRIPLAVASNSQHVYVERALQALGVRDIFRCAIGADQVAYGKPAPDVYLAAAACLDVPATQCLALEDTPVGMQAALAARMRCVAVPNPTLNSADFSGACACFATLRDVHVALTALLAEGGVQA